MPREIVTESRKAKAPKRADQFRTQAGSQTNRIQVETCPALECNLSTKDVKLFLQEMKKYMKLFKPAYKRVEQIQKSLTYLHGLLGNTIRKNVEQMALGQKEKVRSLQYFVGQSQWETEPVIAIHQGLIGESLGEADGVVLIDESSAVKQGTESVGVASQYCGSVGKIANGQVGVYLGYASRKGYSLIEGRLFMPEKWLADRTRRATGSLWSPGRFGIQNEAGNRAGNVEKRPPTRQIAVFLGSSRCLVWRQPRISGWRGGDRKVLLHGHQGQHADLV